MAEIENGTRWMATTIGSSFVIISMGGYKFYAQTIATYYGWMV
jgi:hypothetical protein